MIKTRLSCWVAVVTFIFFKETTGLMHAVAVAARGGSGVMMTAV